MEPLAYLHVAIAYETLTKAKPQKGKNFCITWSLIPLILSLFSVGLDQQAQAALSQGSKGSQVREIQQRLQTLGYLRTADGKFGSRTREAVIQFQQRQGLNPDGIVGAQTKAALLGQGSLISQGFGSDVGRNSLKRGDQGQDVANLQQQLQSQGTYFGSIDGIFGSSTEQAVRNFQSSRGLAPDGVAGPTTLAALRNFQRNTIDFNNPNIGPPAAYQQSTLNNFNSVPPSDYCVNDSSRSILTRGDRGPEVKRLQQQLKDKGFYYGPIDGIFGSQTQQAVREFQASKGIYINGIAEKQTLEALGLGNLNQKPYVVVIPVQGNVTLYKVRQVLYQTNANPPAACQASSNLGKYINAGRFADHLSAEQRSKLLRNKGFDARVVYF